MNGQLPTPEGTLAMGGYGDEDLYSEPHAMALEDEAESYASVPDWLLHHPDPSAPALKLYLMLKHYARNSGQAYPTMATLARDLAGLHEGRCCPGRTIPAELADRPPISKPTLLRYMAELEQVGALTRTPRWRAPERGVMIYYNEPAPKRQRTTNLYRLRWSDPNRESDAGETRGVSPAKPQRFRQRNPKAHTQEAHTHEEESARENPRATPLPDDLELQGKLVEIAERRGMVPSVAALEFEKFSSWHQMHGTKFKDWTAAWRNWVAKWKQPDAVRDGRPHGDSGYGYIETTPDYVETTGAWDF